MAEHQSSVQEIDRITIEVLIDNRTDSLSSAPSNVQAEFSRVLGRPAGVLSGRCLCCAAHGLSLLLTAHVQGRHAQVLFDGGPDAALFERNIGVLGTDLSGVGDVVLSHGHWDHAAGLTTAVPLIKRGRATQCRVHINQGMFVRRGLRMAGDRVLPFEPVPEAATLRDLGAVPVVDDAERVIGDGLFYLSGEIKRTTSFEEGFPGHVKWSESSQSWVDDPLIMDERYLAVRIRNRGILVFSACSHAGAVNVMRSVRERFPADPLFGLVGGLHLAGAVVERKIPDTVSALADMGLSKIVAAHCTGWRATNALVARFGEQSVIPCAVGQVLEF